MKFEMNEYFKNINKVWTKEKQTQKNDIFL